MSEKLENVRLQVGDKSYEFVPMFKGADEDGLVFDNELYVKVQHTAMAMGDPDFYQIIKHLDQIPIELRYGINLIFSVFGDSHISNVRYLNTHVDDLWEWQIIHGNHANGRLRASSTYRVRRLPNTVGGSHV